MVNRSPDRSAAPKSLGFTHIWPSDKSLLLSEKFESRIDSLRSLKHTLRVLMACGHYCMRFAFPHAGLLSNRLAKR
jgi:hypothetical protein